MPRLNGVIPALASVIDLDRYPIVEPDSAGYSELVDHCRDELSDDGCCRIPAFFRPDVVVEMGAMAKRLEPLAHRRTQPAGVYGGDDPPGLPAGHPRRRRFRRGGGFVTADRIDRASQLWTFFAAPAVTRFVTDAFGQRRLFPYADPLACMAINSMSDGDEFPWHFDTNDFTVSVMLTAPEHGGNFEYVPAIRTDEDENYGAVAAVLDGDREQVRTLTLLPGDIQLFCGRNTLHRVAPVKGSQTRNVALPSWSTSPGHVGTLERAIHSYGRALPVHYQAVGMDPPER